jgi:plastocyanin
MSNLNPSRRPRVARWGLLIAQILPIVATAGLASCTKKSEPTTTSLAPAPAAEAPAAATPGLLGKGVVAGTVKFKGTPPEPKVISTPDPFCAKAPIREEDLMVSASGGLKNVIVRVVKGAAGVYEAPKTPAVVDQSGCMYRPRVQVVMAGQTVQIRNSDQTLHNVHTYKGASTMFNQAQIPGGSPLTKTFADGGQLVKFKCDVHPWMTGFVAIASNPFYAVTGDDGAFKLENLPPGRYTLEAWHERMGTRTAEVKVEDGAAGPVAAAFEFAMP